MRLQLNRRLSIPCHPRNIRLDCQSRLHSAEEATAKVDFMLSRVLADAIWPHSDAHSDTPTVTHHYSDPVGMFPISMLSLAVNASMSRLPRPIHLANALAIRLLLPLLRFTRDIRLVLRSQRLTISCRRMAVPQPLFCLHPVLLFPREDNLILQLLRNPRQPYIDRF